MFVRVTVVCVYVCMCVIVRLHACVFDCGCCLIAKGVLETPWLVQGT